MAGLIYPLSSGRFNSYTNTKNQESWRVSSPPAQKTHRRDVSDISTSDWQQQRSTTDHSGPASDRRSPTPSRRSPQGRAPSNRCSLSFEEIEPGQIVFLPELNRISADSCIRQTEGYRHQLFKHPMLVTSKIDKDKTVLIRPVTSCNGLPVNQHYDDEAKRKCHLFIEHRLNTDGTYDVKGAPTLHLQNGKALDKPSYVRLDREMRIEPKNLDWMCVRRVQQKDLILTPESLEALRAQPGITDDPFGDKRRWSSPPPHEAANALRECLHRRGNSWPPNRPSLDRAVPWRTAPPTPSPARGQHLAASWRRGQFAASVPALRLARAASADSLGSTASASSAQSAPAPSSTPAAAPTPASSPENWPVLPAAPRETSPPGSPQYEPPQKRRRRRT